MHNLMAEAKAKRQKIQNTSSSREQYAGSQAATQVLILQIDRFIELA